MAEPPVSGAFRAVTWGPGGHGTRIVVSAKARRGISWGRTSGRSGLAHAIAWAICKRPTWRGWTDRRSVPTFRRSQSLSAHHVLQFVPDAAADGQLVGVEPGPHLRPQGEVLGHHG